MYKPNFKRLDELTEEGYLRKVISPCGKLMLYNYTDKCTYEKKWNKHTLNARGTVYEIATGKVVARSFGKFFNFGELATSKQRSILKQTNFETYEKMDGSLGIVYYYDGEWRVNTRGSFTSDQAVKGKELLKKYNIDGVVSEDVTLLVEIIYPENKIIVNYGDQEELVLLAGYKKDEECMGISDFDSLLTGMVVAPSKHFSSIQELQEHLETLDHTEEGYVVRLENGERVKFKSAEYLKVARIMNHLSPLSLWKATEDGKVKVDYLEQLPEEFREEVDKLTTELEASYSRQKSAHFSDYEFCIKQIGGLDTENLRKEIGLFCKENNLQSSAIFAILDNKLEVLDRIIMRETRPDNNKIG